MPHSTIQIKLSPLLPILLAIVLVGSGCRNFHQWTTHDRPADSHLRSQASVSERSLDSPITGPQNPSGLGDRTEQIAANVESGQSSKVASYFVGENQNNSVLNNSNAELPAEQSGVIGVSAATTNAGRANTQPVFNATRPTDVRAASATIRGQSPGGSGTRISPSNGFSTAPQVPTDLLPGSASGTRSSFQNPIGSGLPAPLTGPEFNPNNFAPAQTAAPVPQQFNPGLSGSGFAGTGVVDGFTQNPIQFGQGQPPQGPVNQIQPGFNGFIPEVRDVPIDVVVQEGRTGRFIFGGSVNTDLGVAGQFIFEEKNFDLFRFPRSFNDLFNGAFKGDGQTFRIEAMPGNLVQRYLVNWTQPNLFGYSPWSYSAGAHFFNRFFQDWGEQRLGGNIALGYNVNRDLSVAAEFLGNNVTIFDPRVIGVEALDSVVGSNSLFTGRVRLNHNTRDSSFLPSEGHLLSVTLDQVFGDFSYQRAQVDFSQYFLIRERADRTGRHTLRATYRFGVSGSDTPIFENFFAGGHTTFRGFAFRGASPTEDGVQVGGRLMAIGSLEYNLPVTADDAVRMVAFVDYGTIERDIEINSENIRVAPGLGLRVAIPALGPAPLAFDFSYPVNMADGDERQVFSFGTAFTN